MLKKASVKKQKRVFRSKEEIQRILSEVSAAQAAGSMLMATLKTLNIPYNTHSKWVGKSGKSAEAPVPVTNKKVKPGRVLYTSQQREEMRQRDKTLKAEGKSDKEVAKILSIAKPTLYRLRKDGKAPTIKHRGRAAAKLQIHLSPDNPMYQLALAHERLMAMNKQIEALTGERDELAGKMEEMVMKATAVCPGLKGKKK
ncbi:MAG: hypothetical protein NTU83_10075 [Candidatus Hydrogenedentes bacterium]|nr:hypothetical protein [Candidatus Hydrogenedentota bacterium]